MLDTEFMIQKIKNKLYSRLAGTGNAVIIPFYIFIFQRLMGMRVLGGLQSNDISLSFGLTHGLRIRFMGQHNSIAINKLVRIDNLKIDILGNNSQLVIGKNVNITDCHFRVSGENALLVIGDGAVLVGNFILIADDDCTLEIGNGSLLGAGAQIRLGDSHAVVNINEMKVSNKATHVKLHNRVWLGLDCLVLKNVEIGPNSVVGARSVITKNLPANSLSAGVPAKVLRTGVTWHHQSGDNMPDNWSHEILRHIMKS
jgi:acetyltransferase-like isoleucine patch superfamily enzyme